MLAVVILGYLLAGFLQYNFPTRGIPKCEASASKIILYWPYYLVDDYRRS